MGVVGVCVCAAFGAGQASAQEYTNGSATPNAAPQWMPDETYCDVKGEALQYLPKSTRRMAGLLRRISDSSQARGNMFLNRQRAQLFKKESDAISDIGVRINGLSRVGLELMNAGLTSESIKMLEETERVARENRRANTKFIGDLRVLKAVAWMRMGEQQNCITNHNAQSCLFPISPQGVHSVQDGSRRAIDLLKEQLRIFPKDRKATWLLNVAAMTVGDYPDKVPVEWLIPPAAFASDGDIGRFKDVAPEMGLDVDDLAGGTVAEDFDNDGDVDLLITDWALDGPMRYFRNEGDGTFKNATMEAGLTGLLGGLNMVQGDFNNDGLMDVLVLRGAWLGGEGNHPDSLLRNDGKGHFTDVTEEAGLLAFHPNQAAVWFDYDSDGWLDLYFGYESFGDRVHPNKLYHNNHDGTFTEVADASGAAIVGFVKGVTSGDFNNDGRPDLYLSIRGQANVLLRNDGPLKGGKPGEWVFTDVAGSAGVTDPLTCFPTFFFDYDNDGWEDLFVCGYSMKDVGDIAADYLGLDTPAERPRLYHNKGDGTFEDVTKAMNLYHVIMGMSANFGDFDNDGFLDIYIGTGDPSLATIIPNRAFRNEGGKRFLDITASSGMGHLQKGHGISIADFDHDGDQDIYHSVGGAYEGDFYQNVLFENPGHGNHWVGLKLVGVRSNRPGLGARIKVIVKSVGGGGEAERKICRTVSTGGSFGANPVAQEIGLGKAESIVRVEVFWPVTGKTQILKNVAMDRFLEIREDVDEVKDLGWKAVPLVKKTGAPKLYTKHHHGGMAD